MSVRPSVCLPVTRWHSVKTAQARITKSSLTDSSKTLVLAKKAQPEVPARALNESGVGKIRNFQSIIRRISETVQYMTKVTIK